MKDYHKRLIEIRVQELTRSIERNEVTIQTPKENDEELKQLQDVLSNYSFLSNIKNRFSFSAKAQKCRGNTDNDIGAWTDGIGMFQDDERHRAYTMVVGQKYKITIEKEI